MKEMKTNKSGVRYEIDERDENDETNEIDEQT
jgi:hypothetical protein